MTRKKRKLVTGLRIHSRICIQEFSGRNRAGQINLLVYCFDCKEVSRKNKNSFVNMGQKCLCKIQKGSQLKPGPKVHKSFSFARGYDKRSAERHHKKGHTY